MSSNHEEDLISSEEKLPHCGKKSYLLEDDFNPYGEEHIHCKESLLDPDFNTSISK